MASGMEKYFQIARCFRDEDLRADRQPEFTQLDIEMSFSHELMIQDLIEELLSLIFKEVLNVEVKRPFIRLKYDDAFRLYGSDKPDLRFKLPITDVTSLFQSTDLQFLKAVLATKGRIGALHVAHHEFTHSELNRWVAKAQELGAKGLLWISINSDGSVESPVHKFLSHDFVAQAQQFIPDFGPGSTLFISAGNYQTSWTLLGQLRLALAKQLELIDYSEFNFSWIVDFPLLEYDEKEKRWNSVHHPFTAPHVGYKDQALGDIKARAYDVVLNGVELGGGSIRIHNRAEQQEVFTMLGLDQKKMEDKFGFLLQAQEYGFPPHGGIALGIDRLIMMMAGKDSIREVIAFPKTQRGIDMMMHAPTPVDQATLKEYGILLEKKDL
jgi:aspartyl-tRNA synthetase